MATPGTPHVDLGKQTDIPLVAERDVDRTASMGSLVKDATAHMSTLVRGEIELAKTELTKSVKQGVTGGVFFIIAAAIGLFSLFFFWLMIGEILATFLPRWLAFVIVFVVMLLMAGAAAFLGLKKVKKVKKPEQTIASLERTKTSLSAAVKTSPEPTGAHAARP